MNYWKYVTLSIVFIAIIGKAYGWYNDQLTAAYNSGAAAVKTEYEQKVKTKNEENRAFEERMGAIINDHGASVASTNTQRSGAEIKQLNKIEELIRANIKYNKCEVDQSVTDARNNIRELGPK
jgi:hypothetical protein